jgi:hypothetical protein
MNHLHWNPQDPFVVASRNISARSPLANKPADTSIELEIPGPRRVGQERAVQVQVA